MIDASRRLLLYGLLGTLSLVFFALDVLLPAGYSFELLQVAIVLLTLFVRGRVPTLIFGGLATVFVMAGYVLRAPSKTILEVTANHGIVLFGLWTAVGVVLAYKHVVQSRRESEARAHTILHTTVEGILTVEADGTIESVNPAAQKIFGYESAEAIGKNLTMLLDPPYREEFQKLLRTYRETDSEVIVGTSQEMKGQRKNGSTFPMELAISEVEIDDRILLTGIVRDITERKQDERRITTQYLTAQILTESDSLSEAAPRVLETVCEKLDWEWGELWIPDPEEAYLENTQTWHHSSTGLPHFEDATEQTTFGRGEGLPGSVWDEQRPKWVPDVQKEENFSRTQAAIEADMRAGFAFPIRIDNTVLGVMVFFSHDIREPDEALLQMFAGIGSQIGQFAERRKTEDALQKVATRLSRAQKVARLGSWEYDLESGDMIWSDQMYRLFGVQPDSFTPTLETVKAFFPTSEHRPFEEAIETARTDASSFRLEHRLCPEHEDSERWMFTQAEPDGNEARVVGTTLDITELKETKKALEESEARAQAILETTVDGIITIDKRGTIETFNQAAEEIFGYDAEEVIGENVKVLMPSPYREEHDEYLRSYLETGHGNIIGVGREVTGKRKDGSTFPMDLAVSEVDLRDRSIFTGIVRDISDRRQLEKELLDVSEQERRRIGQDLHDGLGQMLTGIGLLSQDVARQLEEESHERADDMSEITEHVKEADQYARDLSHGLIPVDVEGQRPSALPEALRRLSTNAERLFDVDCAFQEVETAHVHDNTTASHLYRIAQEAVNNAVRHGGADQLKIILAAGPDQIRLQVRDNGSGFDEDDTADSDGMGVSIMNYRARIIGGTLDISSALGEGTVVTCTLPRRSYAAREDGQQQRSAPVERQ